MTHWSIRAQTGNYANFIPTWDFGTCLNLVFLFLSWKFHIIYFRYAIHVGDFK